MRECVKCKSSIPSQAKVCPQCGAPADTPANVLAAPHDAEDTVHSLLLNAHLLKIRGDSESAISECIKALRANPDSLEAHTLLGDIYKSQGQTEEAARWYKLALDLSPTNRTNREKLHRLSAPNAPSRPEAANASQPTRMTKTNIVFLLTAVIFVLAVILAVAFFRSGQKTTKDPISTGSTGRVSESQPTTITIPAERPVEHATNESARPITNQVATEDPYAAEIRAFNERPALANSALVVTSLHYDPRNDTETITFTSTPTEDGPSGINVSTQSLIIAREAFSSNSALSHVTIRALYPMPLNAGTRLDTVFIGDSSREKALQVDPETATEAEKYSAFDNAWWQQDVK